MKPNQDASGVLNVQGEEKVLYHFQLELSLDRHILLLTDHLQILGVLHSLIQHQEVEREQKEDLSHHVMPVENISHMQKSTDVWKTTV